MKKIYILQSLRTADRKTGKEIYDKLKDKCDMFFKEYQSKQELLDILEYIKVDIQTTVKNPFVHFDCHGNENGIGVIKTDKSEELIAWKEIGDIFRKIYLVSSKKSIVCFSSCKGFNSIKLIPEFKTCPFEYVAGSFEKIGFDDSFEAFKEFYEQIISGIDIKPAAYHIHSKYEKLKFVCYSANVLFELGSKSYLELKTTKDELEKHKQIAIKALGPIACLNPLQKSYLEYAYSEQGQKNYIEKWRRIFFS
jgi:hypothetical protein